MGETLNVSRERVRKNLSDYLLAKKMSKKEFAQRLGISQSAVTNWIKGANSPDLDSIVEICRILEISVSDLFASEKFQVSPEEKILLDSYRNVSFGKRQILLRIAQLLLEIEKESG